MAKMGQSVTVGLLWGAKFINIEINHALIEIGPGMAVKCRFTG